jgi:hypothetical protein
MLRFPSVEAHGVSLFEFWTTWGYTVVLAHVRVDFEGKGSVTRPVRFFTATRIHDSFPFSVRKPPMFVLDHGKAEMGEGQHVPARPTDVTRFFDPSASFTGLRSSPQGNWCFQGLNCGYEGSSDDSDISPFNKR